MRGSEVAAGRWVCVGKSAGGANSLGCQRSTTESAIDFPRPALARGCHWPLPLEPWVSICLNLNFETSSLSLPLSTSIRLHTLRPSSTPRLSPGALASSGQTLAQFPSQSHVLFACSAAFFSAPLQLLLRRSVSPCGGHRPPGLWTSRISVHCLPSRLFLRGFGHLLLRRPSSTERRCIFSNPPSPSTLITSSLLQYHARPASSRWRSSLCLVGPGHPLSAKGDLPT